MRRWSLILCVFLALGSSACIWDSDTLAREAKAIPDVVAVITGRFERNPPLYYEVRLKRAAQQVERNPNDFGLYDDAGAACDRLGRGDEAVRWMERKHRAMEAAGEPVGSEHRYRYLANLGTFIAHRWLKNGADRSRIGEMKKAAETIRRAIKLNPVAHFGREKYQLMAMEWLIASPSPQENSYTHDDFLSYYESRRVNEKSLEELDHGDAARGIAGLVALGNAWESVDVFNALSHALNRAGKGIPSFMAELRAGELIDAGHRSILPGSAIGADLKKRIVQGLTVRDRQKLEVERKFRELREDAEQWNMERTRFIIGRLEQGYHPDTSPGFWVGYRERPMPSLELSVWEKPWVYPSVSAVAAALLLLTLRQFRRWRKRRFIPLERLSDSGAQSPQT